VVRITIDDKLKQQLLASEGLAELCDESGQLIARVTPLPQDILDPWSLFPELTTEEIDRRCNGPGPWLSTEEVKEYLMNRGKRE